MEVRLLVEITGTRDGKPWPPRGNVIDLPDEEARHMIAAEQAVPATGPAARGPRAAERAIVPDDDVEFRQAKERPLTTAGGPVPPRKGAVK